MRRRNLEEIIQRAPLFRNRRIWGCSLRGIGRRLTHKSSVGKLADT